jgi:hypothetical protein
VEAEGQQQDHGAGETLAALAPVDATLGVLREAGFSPRDALTAFRALSGFAYGYALAELRGLAMESAAAGRGPTPSTHRPCR